MSQTRKINRLKRARYIIVDILSAVFSLSVFCATVFSLTRDELILTSELNAEVSDDLPEALRAAPSSFPININTASLSALCKLDGVGDKKARDIIEYREQHGPFEAVEDIMKVSGIGQKIFEKNREKIVV